MKFQIPEANYHKLVEKIGALNKKATKLGATLVVFETLGSKFEEWTSPDGEKVPVKVYEVEVTGEAPKLNGWQFVAKIEFNRVGNVIYKIGNDEVPEYYRDCAPWCDHCKVIRQRKSTYLVVNEAGEFKQVGSTCLKDFTGHANPEKLAQWAEYLIDFYSEAADSEWDPDGYQDGSDYLNAQTYLAYTAWSIRNHGWTSRGDVYDGTKQGPATADLALNALFAKYDQAEILESDQELAKATIEWVRNEVVAKDSLNDYEHNLTVVLADDYITFKQVGIAASAIVAYKREQEHRAEQEKAKDSEYVGTIKKRQVFENLELLTSWSIEGYYGLTHIYKFVDQSGNVLVWFSSSFKDWDNGDKFSGKATVKKHEEYKGIKQTTLTRCSFKKVD